ncbi:MAG: hypothetical protein KAT85_09690, partial [candidate division Zixibacteria bacterium]|nr:hypothetical protein [candidate division Zixibacteria bacterium]
MRRVYLTICLALAFGFLSHLGCDNGTACRPPKITNLQDGDTLVADHCNKLSFQFEADPGGVCGTEQIISWNVVTGLGVVDNEGLFTFYQPSIGVYPMVVEVFNDCVPSLRDEISFYVLAETVA